MKSYYHATSSEQCFLSSRQEESIFLKLPCSPPYKLLWQMDERVPERGWQVTAKQAIFVCTTENSPAPKTHSVQEQQLVNPSGVYKIVYLEKNNFQYLVIKVGQVWELC